MKYIKGKRVFEGEKNTVHCDDWKGRCVPSSEFQTVSGNEPAIT